MKLGLMVVVAVALMVPSLSEGRTVDKCELKDELEEVLVLPKRLQQHKERILAIVVCEATRRSCLDTALVKVFGKRKTTTAKPPTRPTKPVQPTRPTKPVQPTRPTRPTKPVQPTRPTKPTKPVQPTRPTKPVKPIRPTKPVQPTRPTKPVQPTTPTKPVQPTTPTKPVQPTETTVISRQKGAADSSESLEEPMRDEEHEVEEEQDNSMMGNEDTEEEDSQKEDEDEVDVEEEDGPKGDEDEEEDVEEEDGPKGDEDEVDVEEEDGPKGDEDEVDVEEGGERRKRALRPSFGLYGLFQLSDIHFCDSGYRSSKNRCNTSCTAFTDDDIKDDIKCLVKSRYWRELVRKASRSCRGYKSYNFLKECQ